VTVRHNVASYAVLEGSPVELSHHGELINVRMGHPVERPIPPAPKWPRPRQPKSREPFRRRKAD